MKVKGVSLSKYKVKLDVYIYEKLDLFAFLFTRILLDEKIDKNTKIKERYREKIKHAHHRCL